MKEILYRLYLTCLFLFFLVQWRVMSIQTFEYSAEDLPLTGCLLPISEHSYVPVPIRG